MHEVDDSVINSVLPLGMSSFLGGLHFILSLCSKFLVIYTERLDLYLFKSKWQMCLQFESHHVG